MSDLWVADVIGKGWQAYATGPDYFDCWGLVCHGFKQKYGIALDRHLEIPTKNPAAFQAIASFEINSGHWQQLRSPEDGCVVLMSSARIWHHVGLWLSINGGRLLHSREGIGVSLDSKSTLNSFNRVEFWKHVPITDPASPI